MPTAARDISTVRPLGRARAKDGVKCECESSVCGGHGDGPCGNTATRNTQTIYGPYKMCRHCDEALPAKYKKMGQDDLAPVGAEDAKDPEDLTDSELREKLRIMRAYPLATNKAELKELEQEAESRRQVKDDLQPVGDSDLPKLRKELKRQENAASTWQGQEPKPFNRERINQLRNEISHLDTEEGVGKRSKMRELELDRQREERAKKAWSGDDLQPVGQENPARAIALRKHEEGITVSQDSSMKFEDAIWNVQKTLNCSHGEAAKLLNKAAGKSWGAKVNSVVHGKDVKPVGEAEKTWRVMAEGIPTRNIKAHTEEDAIEKLGELFPNKFDVNTAKAKVMDAEDVKLVGDSGPLQAAIARAKELQRWEANGHKLSKGQQALIAAFESDTAVPDKEIESLMRRAKDTELPTAVKPVGLVPLPSGERNEVSYAPRREAKDAKSQWQKDSTNHEKLDQLHSEVTGKGYKHKYTGYAAPGVMGHVYRKGGSENTKPTAIINERKSGNHDVTYREAAKATDSALDPQANLDRAIQYEIGQDRARALDSYRAAASGFRRSASDVKGKDEAKNLQAKEAQARDGIAACQTQFAQEYHHPGFGRVKVCDSAESAVRTALERTRAGERVWVDGRTVRVGDADPHFKGEQKLKKGFGFNEDPSKGRAAPANKSSAWYQNKLDAARAAKNSRDIEMYERGLKTAKANERKFGVADEHEGFQKLEKSLSHEKGVTDPAALAASIGRKKYGEKGMEAKAAAGRANDLSGETLLSAAHEHAGRGNADKALVHYDKAKKALLIEGKKDLAKEAAEGARGAIKYGGAVRAKDSKVVRPV